MAVKLAKKNTKVQKIVKKPRIESVKSSAAHAAEVPVIALPKVQFTEAVGRRKVATARVRLYHQAGDFLVNNMAAGKYFASVPLAHILFNQPLELANLKNQFTVSAKVSGSGLKAQLQAVVHGMARALVKYNPELRLVLKQNGMLVRDDRMKETRKVGMGGKARRKRQSPKR